MAMAEPVHGLEDFKDMLAQGSPYPVYAVLLYTPENSLNQRLREYVRSRWNMLNHLTGDSCLLFAVEDLERDRPIEVFRPEDVYSIARFLGASVDAVPGLVFLTDPANRADVLVVRLHEALGDDNVSDAQLTTFFQKVAAATDACASRPPGDRLACLRERIAPGAAAEATVDARTSMEAVGGLAGFLGKLFG
jgi:hypothetical protein